MRPNGMKSCGVSSIQVFFLTLQNPYYVWHMGTIGCVSSEAKEPQNEKDITIVSIGTRQYWLCDLCLYQG